MNQTLSDKQMLEWYAEAGVDEVMCDQPTDHFKLPEITISKEPEAKERANFMPKHAPLTQGKITPPSEAVMLAKKAAEAAKTVEELKRAVEAFEGCLLKRTATNTVFAQGAANAKVMVIGEAPGEQEDLSGVPFCGRSGQLLDNVLASIGLKRDTNLYITNTIFWRPPGNRTPSAEEVAMCAPFVKKHIALMQPKLLVLAGSVASSVLETPMSVSKLRGKFHDYHNEYLTTPVKAVVIYHPSYLLRQPGQKAQAWKDMMMIEEFLERE